ncbi:Translin-associated factor X-interacting protein [Phytophthora infestans]|uniref:Translin-associated factor X-interacting protein n=1 Tax=Phytophthora infestans TaxID=4787 RepID=A0A833SW62_PHYIN|nr:Translin-associated factor X-interacting protein [Phytophthora infestans]
MLQKLHTRTRLLDDSRTRPALLQELLEYLHTELDGERESRKPSLRRLQLVREALNRLIDGFSVYAPVLMQIRDEYERAVEDLHARNLMIPGLQTRLQSLETHCLQQLSAYSAEAKARSLVLKKRLAETQALLAASTAENARLTAALRSEKDNATKAESKLTDERSLVDARALQKATARYYHACDELAELKKSVAALEEQGNGEHVAADKNTIVLLSREEQELSTALTASSAMHFNQDMMITDM